MAAEQGTRRRRRPYRKDANGLVRWSDTYAAAWFGLLETHKRLVAQLEGELKAQHGLSLSGFELLTRLARAQGRTMRLTTLAEAAGLSLSRVSRVLDLLEARGLVERRADAGDTRAKNAWLTEAGLELLRVAQQTHCGTSVRGARSPLARSRAGCGSTRPDWRSASRRWPNASMCKPTRRVCRT